MAAIENLLHGLRQRFDHPEDVARQFRREVEAAVASFRGARGQVRGGWIRRPVPVTVAMGAAVTASSLAGLRPEWSAALGVISGLAVNLTTAETRTIPVEAAEFSYLHRVGELVSS